jgi:hypothetical protein
MAAYAVKRLTLISPLAYLGIWRPGPMRLLPDAYADVAERLTAAGFEPNRHDLLCTCARGGSCFYGAAVAGGRLPDTPFQSIVLEQGRYAFCQLGDAETADPVAARRALGAYAREAGAAPDEIPVYARLVEEPGDRWIAQLLTPLPGTGE